MRKWRLSKKLNKLAGLEYYEFAPHEFDQTIILLHGYGADATDLVQLASAMKTPTQTQWLFLNAPQTVIIDSYMSGRAWFEIDILELSLVMQNGQFDNFTKAIPPGLSHVRQLILDFIKSKGLDISKTILGGFSQGAMVALDVTFHLDKNPKGLLLFSGSMINVHEWRQLAPHRKGLRFFQSHGSNDPLLRIEIAKKLEGLLTNSGLKGRLIEFNGAHEIPMPIIEKAQEFLLNL